MNNGKLIGVGFIIVGVLLLVWGYNMSSSVGGQFGHAFSGSLSVKNIFAYAAGAVLVAVGIKKVK